MHVHDYFQEEVQEDPRALFLRNIEELLTPLITLFESTLHLKDFLDIVSELCVSAYSISRGMLVGIFEFLTVSGYRA